MDFNSISVHCITYHIHVYLWITHFLLRTICGRGGGGEGSELPSSCTFYSRVPTPVFSSSHFFVLSFLLQDVICDLTLFPLNLSLFLRSWFQPIYIPLPELSFLPQGSYQLYSQIPTPYSPHPNELCLPQTEGMIIKSQKYVWMQRTMQQRTKLLGLFAAGSLVYKMFVPGATLRY